MSTGRSYSFVSWLVVGVRTCVITAFCALLLVACDAGSETTSRPLAGGASLPPGVTFDADVTTNDADITVNWRVVNHSSKELLIPSLVSHKDVRPEGEAYIVAAGRNIEIAQRFFDWPDDAGELYTSPSVGVSRIQPGATESRTIRIPRPLVAYHPFREDSEGRSYSLPREPKNIVFCLGVVPAPYSPGLGLDKDTNGVEFAEHKGGSYADQHRFCTEPVALT